MKKLFKGKVEKGKIVLNDPKSHRNAICALEGKNVELTIQKERKLRTSPENRYYWGVVIDILSDFTGYTEQEMHDALRLKFLSIDKELPTLRSTTELTTVEFEKYMTDIQQWASVDMECYIPEPNEIEY